MPEFHNVVKLPIVVLEKLHFKSDFDKGKIIESDCCSINKEDNISMYRNFKNKLSNLNQFYKKSIILDKKAIKFQFNANILSKQDDFPSPIVVLEKLKFDHLKRITLDKKKAITLNKYDYSDNSTHKFNSNKISKRSEKKNVKQVLENVIQPLSENKSTEKEQISIEKKLDNEIDKSNKTESKYPKRSTRTRNKLVRNCQCCMEEKSLNPSVANKNLSVQNKKKTNILKINDKLTNNKSISTKQEILFEQSNGNSIISDSSMFDVNISIPNNKAIESINNEQKLMDLKQVFKQTLATVINDIAKITDNTAINEYSSTVLRESNNESNEVTNVTDTIVNEIDNNKNEFPCSELTDQHTTMDILTDNDNDIDSDIESIEEFSPDEIDFNEEEHFSKNHKFSEETIINANTVNTAIDSVDINDQTHRNNYSIIDLKGAYEKITTDINLANCFIQVCEQLEDNDVNKVTELNISDYNFDDVENLENKALAFDQSQNLLSPICNIENQDSLKFNENKLLLRKNELPRRSRKKRKGLFSTVPLQCSKCWRFYYGKHRLKKHSYICGLESYLQCIFCPKKLKYKRSLISHLNGAHSFVTKLENYEQIVQEIVEKGNELLAKTKRTPENLPVIIMALPDFMKMYCKICFKQYDELRDDYRRQCDTCQISLMIHCSLCDREFVCSTYILCHLRAECQPQSLMHCMHCSYSTSVRYNMQDHMLRHHTYIDPQDFEACGNCGRKFRMHEARKRHEKLCGKEPHLTCRYCKFVTKHKSVIKMHVQQHVLNNEISINKNVDILDDRVESAIMKPKIVRKAKKNSSHQTDPRKITEIVCSNCGKKSRRKSLRYRCCACNSSLFYKCKLCTFKNTSYYRMCVHAGRWHLDKIYKCQLCSKSFGHAYLLRRHMECCGKEPNISCSKCDFITKSLKGLKRHMSRRHFTNNKFTCPKCDKVFGLKETLQRHLRTACGVEPGLACDHCSFKTRSRYSLIRHIQSLHTDIFEKCHFRCEFCAKNFTNLYTYHDHVETCRHIVNVKEEF